MNTNNKFLEEINSYYANKRHFRNSCLELNLWFNLIKISEHSMKIEDFFLYKSLAEGCFNCCNEADIQEINEVMQKSVDYGWQLDMTINSGTELIASFNNIKHIYIYYYFETNKNRIGFSFDYTKINENAITWDECQKENINESSMVSSISQKNLDPFYNFRSNF